MDESEAFALGNSASFLRLVYRLESKYVVPDRHTIHSRIKAEYKEKKNSNFQFIWNLFKILTL